jgi:hypothetical protein
LENKLQLERIWVQRSIAVVLLFMFWNGFTDVFWMAPSLLFDPLLLVLWLFFIFLHRKELKSLSFIWPLGLAVLLNNFLHFSHFSDLMNRTVILQSENHSLLLQVVGFLSNILTSIGWGLVLWKLLLNNQYRNYWMFLFVLFSTPVLFIWSSAMLFFNGLLIVIFILSTKDRKPFHWFLIVQVVPVFLGFFQMVYWLFSFAPGGKF